MAIQIGGKDIVGLVVGTSSGNKDVVEVWQGSSSGNKLVWQKSAPDNYVLATDADFSGTTNYNLKYIGTGEYVIIPDVIKGIRVTTYASLFASYSKPQLKGVRGQSNTVKNMYRMFYRFQLTELDLSSLDTSNVTNMSGMFQESKMTTLDLSTFDTSKVTNMSAMFSGTYATTLDLSSFNTSKVTNMVNMFASSTATTLDLSNFDTSKVTGMSRMFAFSAWAPTLHLESFDTSLTPVGNMNSMFEGCAATSGRARTYPEAVKFNQSTNRPSRLLFGASG